MSKGLFITFEGMDCSGKTTQLQLLADWLRREKHDVLCTREPGGTPMAEKIRGLLLENGEGEKVTEAAELLMFSAARAQHVSNVIKPHLDKGGIVLCDRFIDSTTAYQGYARGIDMVFIDELNHYCTNECFPHLTFLLDLPLAESRKRLAARNGESGPDRMEVEGNSFHEAVRNGFLRVAEHNPERIRVINACDSVINISLQIREATVDALNKI